MKKLLKQANPSSTKKNISNKRKRRRISKKFIAKKLRSKYIPQIFSPHNTTQYLIANNSSPFYSDEDEDIDFDLDLNINPILPLDSGKQIVSSISNDEFILKNLFYEYEVPPTAAQSQIFQNLI